MKFHFFSIFNEMHSKLLMLHTVCVLSFCLSVQPFEGQKVVVNCLMNLFNVASSDQMAVYLRTEQKRLKITYH